MKNKTKQKGAVLVVSLVLLTVLTLLGVANMSSSTLDLKMAANRQAAFNSFQAAYSAIGEAMNSNIDFTDSRNVQTRTYAYGNSQTGISKVTITVTPQAIVTGGAMIGQSLGSGNSRFLQLEIKALATYGKASSVQFQGVSKRVAGD